MSLVFVVNQQRKPLDPVHPARARFLLKAGHAAVLRRYPFVIIMKDEKQEGEPEPLRIKIDPGSQTTGLAVVNDQAAKVVWAAELTHRGYQVTANLGKRRGCRRSRRSRKTRYRQSRFSNRTKRKGWLPPSLQSRLENMLTWVRRIRKFCPLGFISLEFVRFDTQIMQNPEIAGIEYQQGTLQGYELREYLLLKWGRTCAYCQKGDVPLEIEHLIPKSRGGSNRASNLTLACKAYNQKKGHLSAEEFGFPHLMNEARKPLKDAAAVNATRWALYERLQTFGLPVEISCNIKTKRETMQGIHVRHCHPLHRADGYSYQKGACVSSPDLKVGVSTHEG